VSEIFTRFRSEIRRPEGPEKIRAVQVQVQAIPHDAYAVGAYELIFFFSNSSYVIPAQFFCSCAFLFFWCGSILMTQRVQKTRIRILFESTTGHHTDCIMPSARQTGKASCDGSFNLRQNVLINISHIFFFCCHHGQPSRCHLPILIEVEIIYRLTLELCSKKV
jgi:hypothetical protein